MKTPSGLPCNGLRPRAQRAAGFVFRRVLLLGVALIISTVLFQSALAQDYVITNDDSATNGVSFFTIGPGGALDFAMEVQGPGLGIGGGLFGMSRVAPVNSGSTQCIFATESFTNDIFWIVPGSGFPGGSAIASPSDDGSANGVGIAANAQYAYVEFQLLKHHRDLSGPIRLRACVPE